MIVRRKELEEREKTFLAPYAVKASESLGREYREEECPYRTVFQRDRDRILHSNAFRRLEYKTQVFVNHEGDHYRTRLTHTLEVAQVGTSIARMLALNEDLTEAICLAHDLGHPPFGHAGEAVLDRILKHSGGFNHNIQSFRIVTELEQRYPNFPGLNLSYEVREGIVKHKTSVPIPQAEDFPGVSPSLEAQIADLADSIAYTAHDLDDGLRSGILHWNQIRELDILKLIEWDEKRKQLSDIERYAMVRKIISLLIRSTAEESEKRIREGGVKSVKDVRKLDTLVTLPKEVERAYRELKSFLFEQFYQHPKILMRDIRTDHIIQSLFSAYMQEPKLLPEKQRERLEKGEELERIIADHIAGMTDRYAQKMYRAFFSS